MIKEQILSGCKQTEALNPGGTGDVPADSLVTAQTLIDGQITTNRAVGGQTQAISVERRAKVTYDAYILGPGDGLQIELQDLPELSGRFTIGPEGTLYLPRLRALYVEGLTVEELRSFLEQEYRNFVRDPQIYIRPVTYRPIRVYIGGEVLRPGYYTLSNNNVFRLSASAESQHCRWEADGRDTILALRKCPAGKSRAWHLRVCVPNCVRRNPQSARRHSYSDLSKVQVIRKRAESLRGGRMKTNLNFLSLITEE